MSGLGAVQGRKPRSPGIPKQKSYRWPDAGLSPDRRDDLVIKERTLDEKILLLHGHGPHISAPAENCEADGTNAIPRLGIPALRMADSSYGVTKGAACGRYSTALPSNLGAAPAWDHDTIFQYGAVIGRG